MNMTITTNRKWLLNDTKFDGTHKMTLSDGKMTGFYPEAPEVIKQDSMMINDFVY